MFFRVGAKPPPERTFVKNPSVPVPAGSQQMLGISKRRTNVGIDYLFDLRLLLPEMLRTKWILLDDLPPSLLPFLSSPSH